MSKKLSEKMTSEIKKCIYDRRPVPVEVAQDWRDEMENLEAERDGMELVPEGTMEKLEELKNAATSWAWHQDKSGSPWYTSAPSEQIAKSGARARLLKAVVALTDNP